MFHISGCMGAQLGGQVQLSEALQQLFDEHPPLVEQMEQLKQESVSLLEQSPDKWLEGLARIRNLEQTFKRELEIHSEKEDDGLFPMMARYIGREQGPIAVMEYEHSEAKRNLALFEEKAEISEEITKDQLEQTLTPLFRAIQILLDHFSKEENVLFPMAERMLSEAEKAELLTIVKKG